MEHQFRNLNLHSGTSDIDRDPRFIMDLKPKDLDFCYAENGKAHRTSKYEIMNRGDSKSELVIRRGQEFFLQGEFSRDFDPKLDNISLIFHLVGIRESEPSKIKSCVLISLLKFGEVSEVNNWQARIVSTLNNSVKFEIKTPADLPIGKWQIHLHAESKTRSITANMVFLPLIHIILNPWCPNDVVYMENEAERQEYVMAEDGCIWMGKVDQHIYPIYWKFAQFQKDILDCAFYLINEIADIPVEEINNPVIISRGLSAAINSQDDNGVLVGNWQENYLGGKDPLKWTGSEEILQQYYQTKQPVRFGQCWVFGGVLATVCRAIGMPCRVVTNFESAHDYQKNLRIDIFEDAETNEIISGMSPDMSWDFHVWNEVWMKRLDLGPKYGGWQAIDATPQERSAGKSRCGPTSLVAIKNGDLQLDYDGRFTYAEVNADTYWWKCFRTGEKKLVGTNQNGIGKMISTKAVGSWEREDVTHNYKFPENSVQERESMAKARLHCGFCFDRCEKMEKFRDIQFNMQLPNNVVVGEPFSIVLSMKNVSKFRAYTVSIGTLVISVQYTGKEGETVKSSNECVLILPGETKNVSFDHFWEEYGSKLSGHNTFKVSCSASVRDTAFEYFAQRNFTLLKPNINVQISGVVGDILEVKASLINPLPISLTEGHFEMLGLGGDIALEFKLSEPVEAGAMASCIFSMVANKLQGDGVIVVKFHSNELVDVQKFMSFAV